MSKHKRSVERHCAYCGKAFMTYPKGSDTARFCSRSCASLDRSPESRKKLGDAHRKLMVAHLCLQCGQIFLIKPTGQTAAKRKFCSQKCNAIDRFRNTKLGQERARKMRQGGNGWTGKKRPDVAERMRLQNPMCDPNIREKARSSLVGRTFLSRGGNGKITKQQEQLRLALNLPTSSLEYVICTKEVRHRFPSLPPSYKVDLAIPEVNLVIEVDGKTHKEKKWKFLDGRKTAVLRSLGWTVLRFWNEEIDQDLNRCAQMVMSTISRLKAITTTSQTEC